MQRKIDKNIIRQIAIILLNIFMVISLILILGFKNNYGYTMYWIITPFLMMLILSLIQKWSVGGLSIDTEESKIIQRTFDDKTTISTILFGLIYLTIQGIESWKGNITNKPIVIIGFFIVMVVYELYTCLTIYKANKETEKLEEKKYYKKKK